MNEIIIRSSYKLKRSGTAIFSFKKMQTYKTKL